MKINGIILDIDGVLIGEKKGFNFPEPNQEVINALKKIKSKGVVLSLCTAKPYFSIKNIVQRAKLNNQHISNGGALIIDTINNKIAKSHKIKSKVSSQILCDFIKDDVYVEFYTNDKYFVQKSQISIITNQHTKILKCKPRITNSLTRCALKSVVIEIMPVAKNGKDF